MKGLVPIGGMVSFTKSVSLYMHECHQRPATEYQWLMDRAVKLDAGTYLLHGLPENPLFRWPVYGIVRSRDAVA